MTQWVQHKNVAKVSDPVFIPTPEELELLCKPESEGGLGFSRKRFDDQIECWPIVHFIIEEWEQYNDEYEYWVLYVGGDRIWLYVRSLEHIRQIILALTPPTNNQ